MTCAAHRSLLPDYWLGELSDAAEIGLEDHLFSCEPCTAVSGAFADLCDALRERVPPVLTARTVAHLERQGLRMRHTPITAGVRVTVEFSRDVDILVHHLQQDVPAGAVVDCEMFDASTGTPLMKVPAIPFDAGSGEVILACIRHYAENLPPDAGFRLVEVAPGGERRTLGEFGVLHVVER